VFVSLVYKISTHFGKIQHPIPLQKSIQQFSTSSTRTAGDKNRHVMLADVRAKQSAWELSGKFEGDIALSEEEQRNGLINPSRRWPGRVVPYAIDDVFSEYTSTTLCGIRAWREVSTLYQRCGVRGSAIDKCTTLKSRELASSIPVRVFEIFNSLNPSGRTMALGSTQPLT
jgi:hypothetical protein